MTALRDHGPHDPAHAAAEAARPRHALAPLSGEQVNRTVELLRRAKGLHITTRFVTLQHHQPAKDAVLAGHGLDDLPREAFVIVLDHRNGKTHEAVVSLTEGRVLGWRHVPGVQPVILLDEFDEVEAGAKRSPERRFLDANAVPHRSRTCPSEPPSWGTTRGSPASPKTSAPPAHHRPRASRAPSNTP